MDQKVHRPPTSWRLVAELAIDTNGQSKHEPIAHLTIRKTQERRHFGEGVPKQQRITRGPKVPATGAKAHKLAVKLSEMA